MSDLVKAHKVLSPSGSYFLAILIASEVVISTLAITTHKIIVLYSWIYFVQRLMVISSIFSGWSDPLRGILVIPGRSTRDKSGIVLEYMVSTMGSSMIPFLTPAS